MKEFWNHRAHWGSLKQCLEWVLLVLPIALLTGSASAMFLVSLDAVTAFRWSHAWLLYCLPIAGVGIAFLDQRIAGSSVRGTNLILDEIHRPGGGVPLRMAPLVLFNTLVTHLFGGSAGREGTAVQMGGGLAGGVIRWLGIHPRNHRVVLMAGVAAGFGAVFGTPLGGAVFAMEVLAVGRIQYEALIPCLISGFLGDLVCRAWGVQHTHYHMDSVVQLASDQPLLPQVVLWLKVVLAAVCFGLVSLLFAETSHSVQRGLKRWIPSPFWRPVIGGLGVIAMSFALGSDYLGLGVTNPDPAQVSLLSCFHLGGASAFSWLWKLLFTALTLGSGFKGGEVTPLFFIGAALGNALSRTLGGPADFFAGLGLVAVFAGASNTPLACTLVGLELFGGVHPVFFATACFVAYFFSGHSGIYSSQRLALPKIFAHEASAEITLEELRNRRQIQKPPNGD